MSIPNLIRGVLLALLATLLASPPAAAQSWGEFLEKILQEKLEQQEPAPADEQPSTEEVSRGLEEALLIGAQRAVERASQKDGFFGNLDIRIPMPPNVRRVGDTMRSIGLGQAVDEFELTLNRAAEKASAEAVPILSEAVRSVTFEDAMAILQGGDSAATETLRGKTEPQLVEVFHPIIAAKMDETGVTRAYDELIGEAGFLLALAGVEQQDLPDYVTAKTLDGLFTLLAEEEAKIRKDPVARTTELLRKIFGSLGG